MWKKATPIPSPAWKPSAPRPCPPCPGTSPVRTIPTTKSSPNTPPCPRTWNRGSIRSPRASPKAPKPTRKRLRPFWKACRPTVLTAWTWAIPPRTGISCPISFWNPKRAIAPISPAPWPCSAGPAACPPGISRAIGSIPKPAAKPWSPANPPMPGWRSI